MLDLLEHGYGEQSLVGFGSQLAREILNPGAHERDQTEQSRLIAQQAADARANLATEQQRKQLVS